MTECYSNSEYYIRVQTKRKPKYGTNPLPLTAGVSLVSPVSFLKAKPNTAIFLPVMVLNMRRTMSCVKRAFWWSFMAITC